MTTINNLGVKAKTGELYTRKEDTSSDTSINRAYEGTPTSTLAGTTAAVQEVLDLISIENLGDGAPLFAKRDVNAFFFRSLKTTGGLKLTTTGSTITFDSSDLQLPSLKTYLETPTALPNLAGKTLIVKSNETGLEWIDMPVSGAKKLTELTDYPLYSSAVAGKFLQVNDTFTGVQWSDVPPVDITNVSNFPVFAVTDSGKVLSVDETGALVWSIASGTGGATRLTQLLDYPSYTGQAKKVLQVLDDETGVHWTDLPSGSTVTIGDIQGFPVVSVADAGKVLAIDSEGALVWITTSSTGGATAFTQLNDVPNTYTGNGKKLLSAKEDETGLEYVTVGSISSTVAQNISVTDLNNFPAVNVSAEGKVLTVVGGVLTWTTVSGGSGATKFSDLTDVPSMTGQGGKFLAVKSDETGIEYKDTLVVPASGTFYTITITWNGTAMQSVTDLPTGWEVISVAASTIVIDTKMNNSFIKSSTAWGKKTNGKFSQWTIGNATSYIEYDDTAKNLLTIYIQSPSAASTTGTAGVAKLTMGF